MAILFNTADMTPDTPLSADHAHWIYNGLDCCVTDEIYRAISPMLDPVAQRTYDFSRSLQAPVLEMSMRGLRVDQRKRASVIFQMSQKLAALQANFDRLLKEGLGVEINWRSPAQLNKLFYEVMDMPVQKKRNANGIFAPTTDREALEKLRVHYLAEPICAHLLAMRDLGKSIGFLETEIDRDGRMRSNFNIAGTNTGRWSSAMSDFGTGTNLQNVSSALRSVFVADPGMKFANLDLQQGDSRGVGALCWNYFVDHPDWGPNKAGSYLDACEGEDLHTLVCKLSNPSLPWGTRPDRELADLRAYREKSYRDLSKVLGHGSNYLGTPQTMAKHSKMPVSLVSQFHRNYFDAFPVIPAWHQWVFDQLERSGSITSPFGRRRYFFGRPKDSATRREAVAYTPQSMTGDAINTGILRMWRAERVQLLVQVHDSILFQYPEEQEAEIVPWALDTLKAHLVLKRDRPFHIPTEAMTGWNWGYYGEDNPDGLKKWKGSDSRVRMEK